MRKEFIIYGEPKPQQRARHVRNKRTGQYFIYSPKDNNKEASKQLLMHKPKQPLQGAIKMTISFYLPRPKSVPIHKRKYPTPKPDLTNLERFFEDEMCKLHYFIDDAYICEKHTRKLYADNREPQTIIILEEMELGLF